MRNKRKTQDAFSLVEAILATTILGIAVTGILTTFSSALVAIKVAEDYSKASTMMNELRAHVRTDLLSPAETNEGTFTLHDRFQWNVEYMESQITNLYQVKLTVSWTQGSRNYSLVNNTYHYFVIPEEDPMEEAEA